MRGAKFQHLLHQHRRVGNRPPRVVRRILTMRTAITLHKLPTDTW